MGDPPYRGATQLNACDLSPSIKYVEITNRCEHSVKLFLRFERRKKKTETPPPIELAPGDTSRALPQPALSWSKNDAVLKKDCISIQTVQWESPFCRIENVKSREPVTVTLAPVAGKSRGRRKTKTKIRQRRESRTLHLRSILEKPKLKKLAKRKVIELRPAAYIGPPARGVAAAGSYGYDDVHICYNCGGPIVFRYHPPIPIHI